MLELFRIMIYLFIILELQNWLLIQITTCLERRIEAGHARVPWLRNRLITIFANADVREDVDRQRNIVPAVLIRNCDSSREIEAPKIQTNVISKQATVIRVAATRHEVSRKTR